MEIKVTGDPVVDNLKTRRDTIDGEIKKLAYERLQLMRRVEQIDDTLNQLEGAQAANILAQKDVDLRETIAQARKEAAESKAAETPK